MPLSMRLAFLYVCFMSRLVSGQTQAVSPVRDTTVETFNAPVRENEDEHTSDDVRESQGAVRNDTSPASRARSMAGSERSTSSSSTSTCRSRTTRATPRSSGDDVLEHAGVARVLPSYHFDEHVWTSAEFEAPAFVSVITPRGEISDADVDDMLADAQTRGVEVVYGNAATPPAQISTPMQLRLRVLEALAGLWDCDQDIMAQRVVQEIRHLAFLHRHELQAWLLDDLAQCCSHYLRDGLELGDILTPRWKQWLSALLGDCLRAGQHMDLDEEGDAHSLTGFGRQGRGQHYRRRRRSRPRSRSRQGRFRPQPPWRARRWEDGGAEHVETDPGPTSSGAGEAVRHSRTMRTVATNTQSLEQG